MPDLPFQGTIVGKGTIPPKKVGSRRWGFLKSVRLMDGQALRLICPKGHSYSVAKQLWYKLYPGTGHTRMVTNADGGVTLYLWHT